MTPTFEIGGADGSHYQVSLDAARAKAAGISFFFWKATEGTTFQDPSYPSAHQSAIFAGLPFVPYHLGNNKESGLAQWEWFAQYVRGDIDIVALDIEAGPKMDPAHANVWIDEARAEMLKVIVYGVEDEIRQYENKAKLWIADYSKTPSEPFLFWQTGLKVAIPGIGFNPTDQDLFNGTKADFDAFFGLEDDDMTTTPEIERGWAFLWGQQRASIKKGRPNSYIGSDGKDYTDSAQTGWDDKTADISHRAGAGGIHTHKIDATTGEPQ